MKKSKLVFQDLAVDLKLLSSPDIIDWSFCDLPYIKTFCDEIKNIFKNHSVANDKDGDKFSTTDTLRGASWRGRDCNDTSGDVHPGRRPKDGDAFEDSNCNGIWGRDPSSGRPWEETLCGGSGSRGVAIIGDSAAAHFHVPEAWFDPTQLNDVVLHRGSFVLENEGDWPQLSSSTGFLSSSKYWPFIQGPVDSVYLRLLARNRCNHRDFQNLSVNGADSNKTLDNMRLLSRNATTDEPVIVFYAMNGNDVCNWHHDTLPFMTTAKKMAENLVSTLEYLNSTLPEGSHLIVLGMPDGRFLWDSVHSKIHPLGRLWNDVTYADIYGFWNCLQISPCFGWLNDDATIRNLTQERADNITLGLWDVVRKQQGKWKNVDVTMEESPMYDVITDWVKVGGHVSQLVEPVDGFHPNQFAMALFGRSMWNKLLKYHEDVIGTVNPHNDEIRQRFGDQGGY